MRRGIPYSGDAQVIRYAGKDWEYEIIDADEIDDLEMLKSNVITMDSFRYLPTVRQVEIYRYLNKLCNHPVARKNLEIIRYAVTKMYFGY